MSPAWYWRRSARLRRELPLRVNPFAAPTPELRLELDAIAASLADRAAHVWWFVSIVLGVGSVLGACALAARWCA